MVGKEETLLQLAKTDREKSGKQLLSLLTLHDSYASDKARRTLHKNAFALMKLHRYRDAAAVFLLAQPPYLKEACCVLSRQYNNAYFALLVSRLVELRCATNSVTTASTTATASTASGTDTNGYTSAPSTPIYDLNGAKSSVTDSPSMSVGVEGFLLGPVSRQVVSSDILPTLITAVENSSVRAVQSNAILSNCTHGIQNSSSSTDSQTCTTMTGFNAAVLALVSALWLQDRTLLKSVLYQALHKYSLVDFCAALSGETASGEFCMMFFLHMFI